MSLRVDSVTFDACDPPLLAEFWSQALQRDTRTDADGDVALVATPETPFEILFLSDPEPKREKNRIHLDLTSTSLEDQANTVERLIALGARRVDIGQRPDEDHVVLADPEDNEFCVVQPNNFVSDGGLVGSVTCDASGPAVGYFWAAALEWSLVWDQDDETAIRAPDGTGPFITFGPPLNPKRAKNRVHLDIAPPPGGDQQAEVARLIGLGARRVDIGQGDASWIVMADPDDNEFCVLTPR